MKNCETEVEEPSIHHFQSLSMIRTRVRRWLKGRVVSRIWRCTDQKRQRVSVASHRRVFIMHASVSITYSVSDWASDWAWVSAWTLQASEKTGTACETQGDNNTTPHGTQSLMIRTWVRRWFKRGVVSRIWR
jgi:hypothetical protein